ncbi:YuzL family protein [Sutcliffiella halmapala]|nr:YuzL family protein [Sutcliffiella halmapala]
MAKMKKQPSQAAKSAASVKGNAGPTVEMDYSGKKTSNNQQYGKHNMQD